MLEEESEVIKIRNAELWRRVVVVITTANIHSSKPELTFHAA